MIDTFGYNGVFELNSELVNRLLATQLYEKNLVSINGQISDDDFLPPITIDTTDTSSIRVYLLTGRPQVEFVGSDGTNEISLFVPMFGIGIFTIADTQVQRVDLKLGNSRLGVVINHLRIARTGSNIQIDPSSITDDDIAVRAFVFQEPITHVGGVVSLAWDLSDGNLDQLLSNAAAPLSAKQLRSEIAALVSGGKLGRRSFPFSRQAWIPSSATGIS
jgi:hypothetical protein